MSLGRIESEVNRGGPARDHRRLIVSWLASASTRCDPVTSVAHRGVADDRPPPTIPPRTHQGGPVMPFGLKMRLVALSLLLTAIVALPAFAAEIPVELLVLRDGKPVANTDIIIYNQDVDFAAHVPLLRVER